ncbi:hypothetical protein KAU33_09745 [Candidatus Dependentiae bacterium]|nr:hypothetical protein [Candidatus Dependentiae bacterium]
MAITEDVDRGNLVIKTLIDAYNENRLFSCKRFPEDIIPDSMEEGSNEHLIYLSMISSISYLRKEDQLWTLARDAYEDEKGRDMFIPEKVLQASIGDLERNMLQFGLLLSSLAVKQWELDNPKAANRRQLQSRDSEIWINMTVALTDFDSNIEKLLNYYDFDSEKIIEDFVNGKYSNCFPEYDKKRKVILWLVGLQRYGKYQIKNLDKVPMPIGMHIIRATFMSGAMSGETSSIMLDLHKVLSDYWYKVSKKGKDVFNLSPIEFQSYLWILSKYGCTKGRKEKPTCSLKNKCPCGSYCSTGYFESFGTYVKLDTQKASFGSE